MSISRETETAEALRKRGANLLRTRLGHQSLALADAELLIGELELRRAELETQNHQLGQYRDRYIDLYDFAPLGYVTLDEDGFVQEINLAGAKLLNVDRDALIGYPLAPYVSTEDQEVFLAHMQKCLRERCEVVSELKMATSDDRRLVVQIRSIPVDGPDTEVTLCKTAMTDISDRKKSEAALEQERTMLRTLIDNLPDYIYVKDAEGRFVAANLAAALIMGAKTPNDLLGKTDFDFYPEKLAAEYHRDEQEIMRSGQPLLDKDEPHVDSTGVERIVLTTKAPLKDHDGRVVGLVGISHDVTEKRRAEEDLRAAKVSAEHAKAAAELANRTKDYFLATLSHELRMPLAPVAMGISMLLDRFDLDPSLRETLEMIARNVDLEARLIDDLLDLTRIARGKVELRKQRVELYTVVQRALEVCRADLESQALTLDMGAGPTGQYWVEADVARLQQVFWNLLKNAVKFTQRGGCVAVRCHLDGPAHVVVEVRDNGIGIAPDALPRLFQAFEQGERSITRQFGGLGLGLAISKALVEMHGGTINAYSEGKNRGAAFRVRLPVCEAAAAPELPIPAPSKNRSAVRPLHILLVEDHGVTAKIMQWLLVAEGHKVEAVGDMATALELAGQGCFDLLLSDLGLPDGNGCDLMRELRSRGHRFPGIALSGYGQDEDIQRSHEAGFADHLTKPASRARLVESIASVTAAGG
jgi:two-component system CheB/CheR fusion protein